jgi:hypothetical protein
MARNSPLEDNHPSSPWLIMYHAVLELELANTSAQKQIAHIVGLCL